MCLFSSVVLFPRVRLVAPPNESEKYPLPELSRQHKVAGYYCYWSYCRIIVTVVLECSRLLTRLGCVRKYYLVNNGRHCTSTTAFRWQSPSLPLPPPSVLLLLGKWTVITRDRTVFSNYKRLSETPRVFDRKVHLTKRAGTHVYYTHLYLEFSIKMFLKTDGLSYCARHVRVWSFIVSDNVPVSKFD